MRYATGAPHQWIVTLRSGQHLEVWADVYSTHDGCHDFEVLVCADESEQRQVRVTARTPADPRRVTILVARIPEDEVLHIEGGWPLPGQDDGCCLPA